jgi:ADP-ribose pyrophosphatase YjhB (NUDIX family)
MGAAYTIAVGMKETDLAAWLKAAAERYGTFPDGRVNYTAADIAPVIMCVVTDGNEILLVRRAQGLADAEGYWSVVSGFIDEPKPVAEQARQELEEELGVVVPASHIAVRASYTLNNPQEKRQYIIFPCLLRVTSKPAITLDDEHTDYAWILPATIQDYTVLDDLTFLIQKALSD